MVIGPLALTTLIFSAIQAPEPVVLTPDTMAEHDFFIEVESWESDEYALQGRGAAPISVRVRFDDMQGPAIESFEGNVFAPESAFLIVRDGEDVLVNVPVHVLRWEGNAGGLAFEFSIQNDRLDDAELRLYEGGIGLFTVDISSFLER